jgi:hypothetical protein
MIANKVYLQKVDILFLYCQACISTKRPVKLKKLTKYHHYKLFVGLRKNRKYIENVLDKKFFLVVRIISVTLNINLEYGYQAMGLIESSKRRGKDESRKVAHHSTESSGLSLQFLITEPLAATVSVVRT